jgi:two-component system, LytTR family, response regulator
MIRALIADDEPLARERITRLLSSETDVQIVSQCRDGLEAITSIKNSRPDLAFLDIEMPEIDGLGILREIPPDATPVIIFTTAYDHYAIQAFEAHALDYLLKPFDEERFRRALQRARTHLENLRSKDLAERLLAALEEARPATTSEGDRLVIKSGGKVVFLKLEEIDWVEAAANYVHIHVGNEGYYMRETMNSFEARLDPSRFIRIHRSTIVNLAKIKELQPCNNGEFIVVLRNGKELSLSRGFRDRIQSFLQRTPNVAEKRRA